MRVGLPQLLIVLSHELRGPASVLQGYLRLLHRQKGPGGTDPAIIEAMQTATGRITAIGQDASALAHWLDTSAGPQAPVVVRTVADLLSSVASRLAESTPIESAPHPADAAVRTRDLNLLARALAEVAQAVSRAHDGEVTLHARTHDDALVMTVAPVTASRSEAGGTVETSPLAFDSGGMGLGLILASYVLDDHDATVVTQSTGGVEVRLPLARSAA